MQHYAIPKTVLGRTGVEVTRLGYGAAHRRKTSDEHKGAVLAAVLDAGINFVDTANDYGNSEELIGRFLSGRRGEFWLATKCGCSPDGHIWTKENLFRGLHESLERLQVEYVDIMQLHNPSVAECRSGDLVTALTEMREQGKVRWIGVSTALPDLPTFLEWGAFDVFQIPYSALERDHEQWITQAAQAGIGIIIRGGVGQGEPGVGTGKDERWHAFEQAQLDELCEPGESRSRFVLRFTLTHPHAHTIIVGTTDQGHLQENAEAVAKGPLPADVYEEAKRRLDAVGVTVAPVR